eukprot:TRINITY_DN11210_c0_g1_i1.p1 TRINITY_DN11210_c0_g1~~TRINITY_DN11210_c0_g1_i1.p1  ORF type:complete len:196 (-),score=32.81 TRINITY_DN11210_c0_g1_i1:327-914(-)
MVLWVFGYGSLIWKAGFPYDEKHVGFIKGYRRVFYQGSTDHRGTPEFPGRTVTLEPYDGHFCWGVAYKVSGKDAEDMALSYLEVREKQYDQKINLDFYKSENSKEPAVPGVLVYIASSNRESNTNYLGPASIEEIAWQIARAKGPSGPNIDYVFKLEEALHEMGCEDNHVTDVAHEIRRALKQNQTATPNGFKMS